ncbi:MAG: xanthine dehydrogenase small subunit [Alphaproteobacteria bacterium]|nr:xanthine dehydrogenase small subunit [Alphaproteobacteria bacterium]
MSDSIKFILNDSVREVSGLPPTTTILQYLRMQERLTGTKEGCAEGDCGACTVIVGELAGDKASYQAVNACIVFLPTLDGRHIITVEHLKMNPVQKAMVSCHGSQCGFCTPGFVMSLSALLHNKSDASEENIQDAIAGNLCRCTGYRPILDAARAANKAEERHLASDVKTLKTVQRQKMFAYEDAGKKFFSPRTVKELAEILALYPEATLLAGGTDVGLWVTKQHLALNTIIYTGNVVELRQIGKTPAGLEIGGAVSYARAFDALAAYDESLEELLRRLGSTQVRNLGTVGGNIANGSPIGDGMPPLIALQAKLVLRSKEGARTLPLEDFFLAYRKQDKKPGEFVEKIIVPAKPKNVLFKTYKISKRFDQDISAVCGAFALTMKGNIIESARIAYGGMAATPKRTAKTEKVLLGKKWTEETVRQAMAAMPEDFLPLSDMRASAEYRATVAANLLYRFYLETTDAKTATRVYNYAED